MKLRGLFVFLWLAGLVSAFAGEGGNPSVTTAPVTNPAQVREHYQQVVSRPEYADTDEADVNTHFRDWLTQWIRRMEAKFDQIKYAGEMPAITSLLMSLLVVLSIAGLLYVMVRLTRRRAIMEGDFPEETPGPGTFHPPEFYEKEIEAAIETRDWHAAWLAAWRQFLSRLENRELVEADRTRTNREYLAQLRAEPLPGAALGMLTGMVDAYDRFIYGRRMIAESDWNQFYRQIGEASLLLHLDEKGGLPATKEGA
ncbi:MAG: DUF4129 domain-containing protein [Methylacidiphilales bacterium]|nr:DUF4129 domain-containing protein [Candidatus Methylacidiphilales bacterium]